MSVNTFECGRETSPGMFPPPSRFSFLKFYILRFVSDYLRFQLQRRPQHEKSRLRRRLHLLRADDDRTQVNVAAFCGSQLRPIFTRWRHWRGRVSLLNDRTAPNREPAGRAESWNSTEKLEGDKFKCKCKTEYSCFRFRLNRRGVGSYSSPFAGNRLLEDWLLFCWKLETYPGWMWLAWLIPTLKFIFSTTWDNFQNPPQGHDPWILISSLLGTTNCEEEDSRKEANFESRFQRELRFWYSNHRGHRTDTRRCLPWVDATRLGQSHEERGHRTIGTGWTTQQRLGIEPLEGSVQFPTPTDRRLAQASGVNGPGSLF